MNQATFRAVDPERSRIVLIGTPRHRDESLPDVPVVANNVASLAAVFTDPQLGGFPAEHCVIVPPEADLPQVGEIMTAAAQQATDSLLVYYSGHGLLDRRGGLYLSLAGTRLDQLAYSALPFDAVRESIQDSAAVNRVLILDSCYSGRAIGQHLSADEQTVLAAVEVSGSFTLTSAPANRVALVLDGERHTAFTERLLRLFRKGSPRAGQMLTLADIYRHLHAQLTAESLPVPQRRGTNTADLLGLVRNRRRVTARQLLTAGPLAGLVHAATSESRVSVEPVWQNLPGQTLTAEDQAVIALEQALRITAEADTKQLRRVCLAQVAPVVAALDEGLALGITATVADVDRQEAMRADIAIVVAASDFFRGVEIVMHSDEQYRAPALADIMKYDEREHPGNGLYVLDTYILGGTPPRRWSSSSLREIAEAVATFAPDRAEEIAVGIIEDYNRVRALAGIAEILADKDPDRALRLLAGEHRGWAMVSVASALALIDPDRALALAAPAADLEPDPDALAGIAAAVARSDPDRALGIARGISRPEQRAEALTAVAQAVAATDADRALGILSLIGERNHELAARADVAPVIAASDPELAMRIARTISDGSGTRRLHAMVGVASVLLGTRQRRSSAIRMSFYAR